MFDTLKGKAMLYYYRDKEEGVVESVKVSTPPDTRVKVSSPKEAKDVVV